MSDNVENHTIALLQELRTELRASFDQVGTRFDKTDGRLDRIERRLKTVEHQIIGLRHDEAGAAQEQGQLRDDVESLLERVTALKSGLRIDSRVSDGGVVI